MWNRRLAWVLSAAMLASGSVSAGGDDYLYVLVSPLLETGPTAVVKFQIPVDTDGALFQGATYETGGLGRAGTSEQDLLLDQERGLLFAVNNEGGSVSVFDVSAGGSLSPVPGSPFTVGIVPAFLAQHPELPVLYVALSGESEIGVFAIGADGALSEQQSVSSSSVRELAVSPDGGYLYAVDFLSTGGVRVFEISPTGDLAELAGSPFGYPASRPHYVEVSADGGRVFVLDLDVGVAVFNVEPDGSLELIPGSPFTTGGFSHPLRRSSMGKLYVGRPNEFEIAGFEVEADGALAPLAGSPFAAEAGGVEMVEAGGHSRLYQVSRDLQRVAKLDIGAGGGLTYADAFDVTEERLPNGAAYYSVEDDGSGEPVPATGTGGLLLLVALLGATSRLCAASSR
jgi:hypothetical protein